MGDSMVRAERERRGVERRREGEREREGGQSISTAGCGRAAQEWAREAGRSVRYGITARFGGVSRVAWDKMAVDGSTVP